MKKKVVKKKTAKIGVSDAQVALVDAMVEQAKEFGANSLSVVYEGNKDAEAWDFRVTVGRPGYFQEKDAKDE